MRYALLVTLLSIMGFSSFAQGELLNTYPNELNGYEFFDKGRLKDIGLAVSTLEDVEKNFGGCADTCDYDKNWSISFTFFRGMVKHELGNICSRDADGESIIYVPGPRYEGKLYSFVLIPKTLVMFDKLVFPSAFSNGTGEWFTTDFDGTGMHKKVNRYSDSYGLTYNIFEDIKFDAGRAERSARQKGELLHIEYAIPEKLEEEMFVEEK